ncbi:zinc C3HC4 type protein [Babesia ovata]|uniref:Zinc C3HC4 type protein n=1 Tax=Babesia ovata TaxID=189622 RepID=A0A2H6K8T3_9APIC|nr:zinc C3HC4 type protein [Babesia ovata]GBE59359.1 zinc C3HC4 type protein [Babesia ovata]
MDAPNPNSASLQKMYRGDSATLSLSYVKDKRSVEGLADFLRRADVRVVNIIDPEHPTIFVRILEELALVSNALQVLHIDLWSNGDPELIGLIGRALKAHGDTLLEVSLKCRFGSKFLAQLLPAIPTCVEVLDLSENILSDGAFLPPLVDFVKCSDIRILKLTNCSLRGQALDQLVASITSNLCPISLGAIEGVDLTACEEIPKNVRAVLRDPPTKTRKDHMGYSDLGTQPQRDSNVQFLDYIKSTLLMNRLVGCRVRVWWPATSDEKRSAFSGRFWPAKVLRVNPIDMIFVVEYDNQEVDRVPCRLIQPESAFIYGGGLNQNFLRSIFGVNYFDHLSRELNLRPREVQIIGANPSAVQKPDSISSMIQSGVDPLTSLCTDVDNPVSLNLSVGPCDTPYYSGPTSSTSWPLQMEGAVSSTGDSVSKNDGGAPAPVLSGDQMYHTPISTLGQQATEKRAPLEDTDHYSILARVTKAMKSESHNTLDAAFKTPEQGNAPSNVVAETPEKSERNAPASTPVASTGTKTPAATKKVTQGEAGLLPSKEHDFIRKMLDELTEANNRRGTDVIFPRDLTHLANNSAINIETMAGLDISLSGNVLQPGDVCEFRDPLDSEGTDPSDYIGVVKEVNDKEPMYKVICIYQDDEDVVDLDSNDVRRPSLIPWHLWVALLMNVERHGLLFKSLSDHTNLHYAMADCFFCPKRLDPDKPFKGTPPNPLEMQLQSMTEYAAVVKSFSSTHPRIEKENQRRNRDPDSVEGLRYQLRKSQQKMDTLLELYEAARQELEQEREVNLELQAKLNCVVCFEK